MDTYQAILLALIQGLTEFLPISSSAHLILPAQLLDWPDQGLAFDVAVHFGTLVAVLWYFRREVHVILSAWLGSLPQVLHWNAAPVRDSAQPMPAEAALGWMVIMATLPAVIAGLFLHDLIADHLRSTLVIATTTIAFGLLLGVAEWQCRRRTASVPLTWKIALIVGLAQAIALVPGTSRSGITITAAAMLGLSRVEAARFSFLLSIPLILAAALHELLSLIDAPHIFSWTQLILGLGVSAISAYLCIDLFLKLLDRVGLMPFVWYRLLLGLALLFCVPAQ